MSCRSGVIEMGEAFFGSGGVGGKRGRGKKKTPVIIEASTRDDEVSYARMHVIEHVDNARIGRIVADDAAAGQTIKTDGRTAG